MRPHRSKSASGASHDDDHRKLDVRNPSQSRLHYHPVVIEAPATISNPGFPYAVYRYPGATTFFDIDNHGTITSGTGIGVYLAPGGAVTNATSASVVGGTGGIKIAGGIGTIANYGSIAATGTGGFNGIGIYLKAGGSITNAASASQMPCASATYWHVELASHDAIVAEGLAAETYLDTGNRADFANGGPTVTVHPTFADAVWRARACAPQLRHGDALRALQRRLAARHVDRQGSTRQPSALATSGGFECPAVQR
jgi:hypothetical protein